MFSTFLFGFGMASFAKAQQKMSNPCTSKSRNLELHSIICTFLLAAGLDFQLYWRAMPSFPVLANTGIYIYIYIPQRKAPHLEIDSNVLTVPCPLPFVLLLPLPPPSSLTLTLSPVLLFFCQFWAHILKTLGGILASFWHPLDTLGVTLGAIGHHLDKLVHQRLKISSLCDAPGQLRFQFGLHV